MNIFKRFSAKTEKPKKTTAKTIELGTANDFPDDGIFKDESIDALSGVDGLKIFNQMQDDPYIGGTYLAITRLLQKVKWPTIPYDNSTSSENNKIFLDEVVEDMNKPFSEFLSDNFTIIKNGFAWNEEVYKLRGGDNPNDKTRNSKFSDGKVGWRKLAIRSPLTLLEEGWTLDENGGVQGVTQVTDSGGSVYLPIENCLHMKLDSEFGNPQGRSMFKSAYKSWKKKQGIEKLESIGIERDLAGMPRFYAPEEYFDPDSEGYPKPLQDLQKQVSNVRNNDTSGMVIPSLFDENGNRILEFDLISSSGTRQFDIDKTIKRLNLDMVISMLADFMVLGADGAGSLAMHKDKTTMFIDSIEAILKVIRDVLNNIAIPRLFSLNGITTELPKFDYEKLTEDDLNDFVENVVKMVNAGVVVPEENIETIVREKIGLPVENGTI